MSDRGRSPSAVELLDTPGALLTRTHLRDLGLGRSAIDAVFRALDVVVFPGTNRPMIKREQYLELIERSTYRDDRVRPTYSVRSARAERPDGAARTATARTRARPE